MIKRLMDQLTENIHDLNARRQVNNHNAIDKSYGRLHKTIAEIQKTTNVKDILESQKEIIGGSLNSIPKTAHEYKIISKMLEIIAEGQEGNNLQIKKPKQFHTGTFQGHSSKHIENHTPLDKVRVALETCRKHSKTLVIAPGAAYRKSEFECNSTQYEGLVNAEREYIERQIHYSQKYVSPEVEREAAKHALNSFDAKIRVEKRPMQLSPEPPE